MTVNTDLLPPSNRAPDDPPVFILLASPSWAPWLPDTAYQKVPIGGTGQVLTVQADGSINWQNSASGFANPMTTAGDLLFENAVPAPARLPIGTAGQVLTVVSGLPAWAASSSLTNPMTTLGDIITGGGGGTPTRLPAGAGAQVLTIVGGVPTWANATTGFANPMTTLGDLITGGSGGSAQRLAIGSNGNVLSIVGGVPLWVASSTVGFPNPMTTSQDLILGGTGGAAGRLAVGANGQVLSVTSGSVGWANAPTGFTNPMTAPQDLIVGGTSGAATRLPVGANGTVLSVTGGVVGWTVVPGTFYLSPSGGDDTVALQNAVNAVGVGMVFLAAGTFTISSQVTVPHKASIMGNGALTRLKYTGASGACLYMHDPGPNGGVTAQNSSGALRDFVVDGTSAGNTAIGIDIGDGWGYRIEHVFIESFGGTSAIGLYINNNNYFTEKMTCRAVTVRNCTTDVHMTSTGGGTSFEFNDLDFYLVAQPGQDGFVLDNNCFYNGHLRLRGNFYTSNSSFTNAAIRIGTSSGDTATLNSTTLDVVIENDLGHTFTHQSINFGGVGNTMQNCTGMLAFRDPNWTVTNAARGQFTFRGILYGDATLALVNEVPSNYTLPAVPINRQPTNPAATASTTLVMMGLGQAGTQPTVYTPTSSGTVQVTVVGMAWTNTAAVQLVVGCRYGTGAAPANGVAVTGTRFGMPGDPPIQAPTTTARQMFAFCDTLTLTPGTAYWFDLAVDTTVAADTAQVSNVSMNFIETS